MENGKRNNIPVKVGVLGLGLIGGSILKALFELKKYHLTAISVSSYKKAAEFSNVSGADILLLSDCDVVFVCSKMSDTNQKLKELENIVHPSCIVADCCSIKNFLKNDYKFNFITSHPMAGTEFSGFENSFKELFIGAKWILSKKNEILETLIKEMGAKPVIINPNDHDEQTAEISHLPMVLALSLFDMASDDSKKIASSGFRDMTRLALTNYDLAYDMLKFNKKNIEKAYKKLIKSYNKIINMNEEEFKQFSAEIAEKRAKMYDRGGKNTLC